MANNEAHYFDSSVWVISLGEKIAGKIAFLSYLPDNIHYMPGNRRYPFILAFSAEENAKAYLEFAKLHLHQHEIEKHTLWDIVTMAIEGRSNIAIDKRDDVSPHAWINVIKMISDIKKEGHEV